MSRPSPVLLLIIRILSGEALRYAFLSNLLSFFLLISEHFPQHSVLKHSVSHCSNIRIIGLCLVSR